jgi:hypothetical protein
MHQASEKNNCHRDRFARSDQFARSASTLYLLLLIFIIRPSGQTWPPDMDYWSEPYVIIKIIQHINIGNSYQATEKRAEFGQSPS